MLLKDGFECRLTLLLGPPSCGKTTLLMALAGKLEQSLEVSILNTYQWNKSFSSSDFLSITQKSIKIRPINARHLAS